jgi:hypothetical protein
LMRMGRGSGIKANGDGSVGVGMSIASNPSS